MNKKIFVDSNCWFRSKKGLFNLIEEEYEIFINSTVIYEVMKQLDLEIHIAKQKKREKRLLMLNALKIRFPKLMQELSVHILSTHIDLIELSNLVEMMESYKLDIGDTVIYHDMLKNDISKIMTFDDDWKRINNINIIIFS